MTFIIEAILRLLGLFYVLSGVLVVRSLAVSAMADAAYAAIMGGPPHPAERAREIWLAAGSVLIGAGGLALVLLLDVAVVLFVLGALQQMVYLVIVAPRFLDPHDAPDGAGRAKTWQAAIFYLVVTALVVAAAKAGLLRPWQDMPAWLLAAAGAAVVLGAAWTVRALGVRGSVGAAD
ncbi:hypothetical protein [Xanthobacter autotrophicus]|uniref:hypothetical protein n=1 Tax=Xanthobacter autotrophicus TaxID=280 RepID=UPI0024A6DF5B|nr:hypothetical protein [Xanthobacter autotrophicus]MDI4655225.1 hypothetical protein [Xanthobacter autotrophicus]